jgi:hypothetical protein
MRSIFRFCIAALALVAMALYGTVTVRAADEKLAFSGNTSASFGQVSYGETAKMKSYSELATSIESNLRFTAGDDQLQAIGRFRIRGHSSTTTSAGTSHNLRLAGSQPNDVYVEIHWKPMPQFDIAFGDFQGQAWSQPYTGTYIMDNPTPLAAQEYWMNWTGISGIDFDFNAGVVDVGLAIATQCRPSCSGGTAAAKATDGEQSIVPHLTGKFGPIGIRAQLPQTAAKSGDVSLKGSGFQLGVEFASAGFSVGLDAQSFTDKAALSSDKDVTKQGTNLKLSAAGAQLLFSQIKPNKDNDAKNTEIKLAYSVKVGAGEIIPILMSTKVGGGGTNGGDQSNTGIFLAGNVGF